MDFSRVTLLLIALLMASAILIPCARAGDPLVADFAPDCGGTPDASGGILVTFTDTSTGAVDIYAWDFGDGTTSTDKNPSKLYTAEGNYPVTHTIRNATTMEWATITREFATTCPHPLVVDFTAIPYYGVQPLDVQFQDITSSGDPATNSHLWIFGDGGTSIDANPRHTFATSGTYTVNLTVTELSGNNATLTKPYYIHVGETVNTTDFSGSPRCGFSPFPVRFIDEATLPHDQWEWNFGDGGMSNLSDPQYTYNGNGTWTVSLYISNSAGGSHSIISKTDYIRVVPEGVVSFTASGTITNSSIIVQFNDTSTGFISPVTYAWDFGDGETSADQNPVHTYTNSTLFSPVTFTVTGDCGQTGSQTEYLSRSAGTVLLVPKPSSALAPVADFTGDPISGAAPLAVNFTDLSTNMPTTWNWSFGDGNFSALQNPVNIYTHPGNYTVSLVAANPSGSDTKIRNDYITVSGYLLAPPVEPLVNFTGTPTYGSAPLTVQFTDASTGFAEPVTYLWDFGDMSSTSSIQNPAHTYTEVGLHTVSLTVTGSDGYAETLVMTGYINTEVPSIELILSEEPLDASILSSEVSLQAESIPIASYSELQVQSSSQTVPGYFDQSLPIASSTHTGLSAENIVIQPPIIDWSLKSNFDNIKSNAFWMMVLSKSEWQVQVYDGLTGNKPSGTVGRMAEYDTITSTYVDPFGTTGKSLTNPLRVQSEAAPGDLGPEISLSGGPPGQTIESGPAMPPGHSDPFKYSITLKQLTRSDDKPLSTNRVYHIVITFDASPVI